MSSREIIDAYVSLDAAHEVFKGAGLPEEEVNRALATIQHDRAQFVVDAAAGVLLARKVNLMNDSRELQVWQQEVHAEIEEIDTAILTPQKSRAEKSTLPEKRKELLRSTTGGWDSFLERMYVEPPFVFSFEYGVGIWRWVDARGDIFEDVYGLYRGTCTRACSELHTAMAQIGESLETQQIITLKLADGDLKRIEVLQPGHFFEQLALNSAGRVSNRYTMGPKLATAILCVADVQAQERELAQTVSPD